MGSSGCACGRMIPASGASFLTIRWAALHFFSDNPSVYAGNNPLSNVDPSGQYRAAGFGSKVHESWKATKKHMAQVARMKSAPGKPTATTTTSGPMVLTALAGTSPACDSIDVPCLLSHLDLSKVNWGEVAQGAVSYLGGTASLAAGMAALGGLLTNPEAFFAEAALVTLFGGTPATAFFAIFALITAGLSFMVHALATVLSGLGIMNGMLASLFTLVEMGVDALAVAFGTATLATTAEGLFTGLAGVAATFIGLGDNHNDYG